MTAEPRLYGVLVTYRRPVQLAAALSAIGRQSRPLHELVVVDNDGSAAEVVTRVAPGATYVRAPDNLGPAGGIALGMQRVLETARPTDWMFTFDDDDWAWSPDLFADLLRVRAAHDERGPVDGGGRSVGHALRPQAWTHDAHHRRRAARAGVGRHDRREPVPPLLGRGDGGDGGVPRRPLLRVRGARVRIAAPGARLPPLRRRRRVAREPHPQPPARPGEAAGPGPARAPPQWERYYSIRNLIVVLRANGAAGGAVRVTATTAIAKPLANLARVPRYALQHLRLGIRASRDGWSDRLGRTLDPGGSGGS